MCKSYRKQFSSKAGTIFEDAAIGLDKWMTATRMITNANNGVSSYELGRSIGVTQKGAWFMLQRIRLAMQDGSFSKASGQVEVDETPSVASSKHAQTHPAKESHRNGWVSAATRLVTRPSSCPRKTSSNGFVTGWFDAVSGPHCGQMVPAASQNCSVATAGLSRSTPGCLQAIHRACSILGLTESLR